MTIKELTSLIQLLEAEIPANPQSQKNQKLAKKLESELNKYFQSLEQAFPYGGLEKIYNRNITEVMTPSDWKAEYKKGVPHWAKGMEPSIFAKEFVKLLEEYKINSVLEVGCGNGRDSILFAKSGYNTTSIDIVPKAIELARRNAKKAEVDITFKIANVEKLPFKNEEFGSFFTLSVLHSTNLQKSLPELTRVLQPEGVAFIHIYGDTQFEDGKKKEDTIDWNDYLKYLKSLGFKIKESYTENEKEFDEFGEKHRIFVVQLQKAA
jgi:ubiquinone/menaquinone biosynthesis C-methylase UbiE